MRIKKSLGFTIAEISLALLALAMVSIFMIKYIGNQIKNNAGKEVTLIEESYIKLIRKNLQDPKACIMTFEKMKFDGKIKSLALIKGASGSMAFSVGQKMTNSFVLKSMDVIPIDTNQRDEMVSVFKLTFANNQNTNQNYYYRTFLFTKSDKNTTISCRLGERIDY